MTQDPEDSDEINRILQFKPSKWSLVIITSLKGGVYRFSELKRRAGGINQKTLAAALRDLERDGFVKRTAYAIIPPKVEYELTSSGQDLLEFAENWRRFIIEHTDGVQSARRTYDEQISVASAS